MENIEQDRNITTKDIYSEMKEAYLQYSMSVIVGRALPDVRDGLKPVHRRILFAQYEMGNTQDKPFKKSARIVGDVIGKYHPHGDTAVYDTMVRMAQNFSLRYPLEDGQGNFGSVDGDSPAAMRYTEIRMTSLAEELLIDLDKNTVPLQPNYDDSLLIPSVLPSKIPNLLINGSSGIAVGMATNIPPHNMGEVVDAILHVIQEPDCSVESLLKFVKGPDFPTAGLILKREGIKSAYLTGRGSILIKARAKIEAQKDRKEDIIITEIPYQVNKAKLIESIADLVKEKKIEGITDIRDESSREGMRIVISLKKDENASVILNRLYKFTQMEVSYGIILLALDKNLQPRIFNLKEIIKEFLDHRVVVVTRRTQFDLDKAQKKQHILLGLQIAVQNIDKVIATIRASKNGEEAMAGLMKNFSLTEEQSKAVLDLRLQRLTSLERDKIKQDIEEVERLIAELKGILQSRNEIYKVISHELNEIKKKYSDKRRTEISRDAHEIDEEDLISDDSMFVTITQAGYIKRISTEEYRTQKRGGKGVKGSDIKDEDYVTSVLSGNNKSHIIYLTNLGRIYINKIYEIPMASRTSKGRSVANLFKLGMTEKIQTILCSDVLPEDHYLVMITEKGVIKKTPLSEFKNVRQTGIIAMSPDDDDNIIDAKVSNGKSDIFIATREGMSIRFHEEELRPLGRTARGVKGIQLTGKDYVVSLEVLNRENEQTVLMVTTKGFGKKSSTEDYRTQARSGVGVITQKISDRVGVVVGARLVSDSDEILLTTNLGQAIRIRGKEIPTLGRNTQGVKLFNIASEEYLTGFAVINDNQEEIT